MAKKYISILVANHAGVLARVASLFNQRGFNIDSLTVSATNNEEVSRITVSCDVDDSSLYQILKQTGKLYETEKIFELKVSNSLLRELLLVKVRADAQNRHELRDIADIFKAKIIDLSPDSMVFELTGEPEKIDGFLEVLKPYEILEMCRTGATALERGWND